MGNATGHPSTADDPGPISLAGSRICLAPVRPDDHQFLHWLANAEQIAYRWRYRSATPPFEVFVQHLNADVLAQFVVRDRQTNDRLGHVVAYAADLRNRTTFVANTVTPDVIGRQVGGEAQNVFLDFLFAAWDFRKIYVELPEFTFDRFESIVQDGGFEVEGRLRAHTYYKGRYWDQIILAVTNESWERRALRL